MTIQNVKLLLNSRPGVVKIQIYFEFFIVILQFDFCILHFYTDRVVRFPYGLHKHPPFRFVSYC